MNFVILVDWSKQSYSKGEGNPAILPNLLHLSALTSERVVISVRYGQRLYGSIGILNVFVGDARAGLSIDRIGNWPQFSPSIGA